LRDASSADWWGEVFERGGNRDMREAAEEEEVVEVGLAGVGNG
jgi:hypothetical protein